MAKIDPSTVNSTEDADDIVYVSGVEDKKETVASSEPGMILQIKNLYRGEMDDHGRFITTDKIPDDLPEPEETEETARYALLIRNNKCYDGRKSLSIASIVVQSPLLKKVLCWVLKDYPRMAPELNRFEIVAPFHPFVHRWQRLTEALDNEQDPLTKSHIQLFYDALKEELQVTLEARADFLAHGTITFKSLWMIFEPGDIIYTTTNKRPAAARLGTASIFLGRHEDFYRLECDMTCGDGQMFGWVHTRFDIPDFGGMVKITDLVSYPLKYHPKAGKIKKQLIEKGRAYERMMMGYHHMKYQGIALNVGRPFYVGATEISYLHLPPSLAKSSVFVSMCSLFQRAMTTDFHLPSKRDEDFTPAVESRIILDPDAYRRYNPDQDFHLQPLKKISVNAPTSLAATDEDREQLNDATDEDESSKGSHVEAKKKALHALTEDQLLVCFLLVPGYSLRNKRWLDFFVDSIEDIEWDDGAWDNVVLKNDLKDLIISMTKGHLQRHQDLQSKGLNILLSGCSGVGKTFTVESVAEALHAPLFYVTPADVDLDAKEPDLESPFTEILDMCGKWNAILLFDQAQGALEIDTLDDDRAREYSLLLDALGSHSAAFFVTSNLAAEDCMDDRIRSRFHVCLQLPWLTPASRAQIWRKSLESYKDMSFFVDPTALADWNLNGREIANAVTAAMTLVTDGVIQMEHLERVVPASKRPLPVFDEPCFLPPPPPPPPCDVFWNLPPKKDKKKKKSKMAPVEDEKRPGEDVAKVIEEPPISNDDTWAGWGSGAKKNKKGKARETIGSQSEHVIVSEPTRVPGFHDATHALEASKKDKETKNASKEVNMPVPPPPPPPVETEAPTKDGAELSDGSGSFDVKKEKKVKKAMADDTDLAPPPKENEVGTSVAAPSGDEWDIWARASKKTKKGKKKAFIDDAPPLSEDPAPVPTTMPIRSPSSPLCCVGCRDFVEYEPVIQNRF
ncbi:MAG: hypothetical protein Q9208_004441 [Pyrenodesmia sp. 3 TL-2023]